MNLPPTVNKTLRILVLSAGAITLASCGIFGDDEDEALEPVELVDIDNQIKVRRLWSARLGKDAEFLRVALRPVGDGSRVYAASVDGNVYAFDPESGKRIWRTELDLELAAGPGVGEGLVVVAAEDGLAIALDASTGQERWRSDVGAESLAAPVVKGDIVVAQTVDNRIHGLAAYDGSERWTVEQPTPALTVRGSSSPALAGTSVIVGFDNGRLAAVDLDTGDVLWEQLLSPPQGRSDLERLADIDGGIAVVGQDVYAAGYQGRLAALAAESGQLLWVREISSIEGVSADWNNVYTVREGGEIVSMIRRDGAEEWRDDSLLRRELTLPVSFDTTVVVGDLEGYLHFFSNVDGEAVARLRFGGAAITADPMVMGNRLYVQSDDGTLGCFVIQRPRPRNRDRDIAADET